MHEAQLLERVRGDARHGFPIDLDPPVEAAHGGLGEASAQLRQRGDGSRGSLAHARRQQRRRLVGRKEAAVVRQHDQIVLRDQTVGRIPVDHVDLARGQRLVLHGRQQRADLPEPQPVGALEPRQAVGAADEVRREPGAQRGPDAGQVGQGAQPETVRGLAPHGDRVGVLEAQRRKPADAEAVAELAGYLGVGRARIGRGPLVQDREQARAGVLRVHVDGAAPERRERDLGRAEAEPALRPDPAGLEQLSEHLGQEVRLAERLGRHDDRTRLVLRGGGDRRTGHCGQGRGSAQETEAGAAQAGKHPGHAVILARASRART